ncbi:MAG: 2Fe-2S iron-sulfur cluster-binding protein [Candidatus Omnitrophica bacterium]|nr:2Fe-2S iron-sulfur cluster-binding protein [Candidatus Omnitrophota bacterium]MCM8828191.1 2Fe-2S iron-sulfur cluster-binding protein [Candidatus Omnitrophota bacterium]
MVNITVNSQIISVKEKTYILEAAKKQSIDIPALCWQPGLEPHGACRLCLVEIEKSGRKRMVTSCNYPVEEGLIVRTNTEEVVKTRKIIIELLLARCSTNKKIQELAEKYGVTESRFEKKEEDCILCGLCVRVCREIIGKEAIGFSGRGIYRKVTSPFEQPPQECIGCGSCAFLCPTGAIKIENGLNMRKIAEINCEIPLVFCQYCGRPIAPLRQIEFLKEKTSLPEDIFYTCAECKRKNYARRLIAMSSKR